eukprot:g39754.t1
MLPVALEDLLFYIMPIRFGSDGKIAKSFILRLQFCILTSAMESHRLRVCELRASAARLKSDSGVTVQDRASPSLCLCRTCSDRVSVRPYQQPGVSRCDSMRLRRLDSRLGSDPNDVCNISWQPGPHGSGGSAITDRIAGSNMNRTSGPMWRLYPWLYEWQVLVRSGQWKWYQTSLRQEIQKDLLLVRSGQLVAEEDNGSGIKLASDKEIQKGEEE